MRISIAEQKAPLNTASLMADGQGPAQGYLWGETEDYYLTETLPPGSWEKLINGDPWTPDMVVTVETSDTITAIIHLIKPKLSRTGPTRT